jgi:MoxR-like ATPase
MSVSLSLARRILATNLPARIPTLFLSRPGVGKSAAVEAVAGELGYRCLVFHPALGDPTDFKGLPAIVNGQAEFLPYGEFRSLLEASEPTVAFFDDLAHAPRSVQAALMHLVHPDSRRIGDRRLPDCVSIAAASNQRGHRAGADSMITPLWGRFPTILSVEPDVVEWTQLALDRGWDPLVPAYLRRVPDDLSQDPTAEFTGFPSPRAWEYVARNLALGLAAEAQLEVFTNLLGPEVAVKFTSYLLLAQALPDPAEIFANPKSTAIPDDASLLFAVAMSLARQAEPETAPAAIEYLERCGNEWMTIWVERTSREKPGNLENSAYGTWAIRNDRLLLGREAA